MKKDSVGVINFGGYFFAAKLVRVTRPLSTCSLSFYIKGPVFKEYLAGGELSKNLLTKEQLR
jgi:hypothetical protein